MRYRDPAQRRRLIQDPNRPDSHNILYFNQLRDRSEPCQECGSPVVPEVWLPLLPGMRVGDMRLVPLPKRGLVPLAGRPQRVGTPLAPDRAGRGVRFVEHPAHSILNPPEATGMPFWSLNPYVGCEFGCRYCYARFAHGYALERARKLGPLAAPAPVPAGASRHPWEAFERTILVKQRAQVAEALDHDLARLRHRHGAPQAIAIGTATDPYQPAERKFRLTRFVLERLAAERGLRIAIVTKSPLVARDIAPLGALAARHQLAVHISLISMDARLVRLFEPRSPVPRARLRALARLTAAGLDAGIICAPILPGLTDGARHLRAVLRAARDAGAGFAHAGPLRLYPAVREPFLPIVQRHFPGLARRYEAAYGRATDAPARYRAALDARFAALAAEVGLPVHSFIATAGRHTEQLRLW
jgi:DNA repair photolyase